LSGPQASRLGKIDPEAMAPKDPSMLEDLIVAPSTVPIASRERRSSVRRPIMSIHPGLF